MTWVRLVFLPLIAATLALSAACGSSADLPDASILTKESSAATAAIEKTHLRLKVNGEPFGVRVREVDGDVDKAGNAKGFIKVNMSGTLIEGDFVLVDGQAYFKGPTGGYEEYTVERTKALYDTTVILNPERGLAHLLEVATDTKTEDEDTIHGRKVYKVTGKLAKEHVRPMVPGLSEDLTVVFWIPADGPRHLVKVWFSTPNADPAVPTVEAELTNIDKPFDVAKPL